MDYFDLLTHSLQIHDNSKHKQSREDIQQIRQTVSEESQFDGLELVTPVYDHVDGRRNGALNLRTVTAIDFHE